MTVVSYPHIEPQGPGPWIELEQRSATAVFRSPIVGTVRRLDRVGSVWAGRVIYRNLSIPDARRLEAFLHRCRGQANSFYMPLWTFDRRGSGIGTELVSNGDFSNGTTSWSSGSEIDQSVSDYLFRATRNAVTSSQPFCSQSVSLTRYLPYAIRGILHEGRGSFTDFGVYFSGIGGGTFGQTSALRTEVQVPLSTGSETASCVQYTTSGVMAGDYLSVSFMSCARCAMVDDGPNYLTYSEQFDNAAWTKTRSSISADSAVAPDGNTTADQLIEDSTASNSHYVEQTITIPAAAADVAFSACLEPNTRTFANIQLIENTGSSTAEVSVNLSTGSAGTPTAATNWSNPRAFVEDLGSNFLRLHLIARKTNAATSVTVRIYIADALDSYTYNGDGSSNIRIWGASLAISGVPVRYRQTEATADSDGTSQTGNAIYLKGLPESMSGILLAGDWCQLTNTDQIIRASSVLNSDAAGLGYLEFEASIRTSPSNDDPLIDVNPMGRFLLDGNTWHSTRLADNNVDIEFSVVEDISV